MELCTETMVLGAFIKLAKVLNIDWVVLGDNDGQGEKTKNEILNCGYKNADAEEIMLLTNEKDFEHELANVPTIFNDYESILREKITEDINKLKEKGENEKYVKKVVELIQKGKVENAYNLLRRWDDRGLSPDEIPQVIQNLIGRV